MTSAATRMAIARRRVRRHGGLALIEVMLAMGVASALVVGMLIFAMQLSNIMELDRVILNEQRQLQADEADLPVILPEGQTPILAGCGIGPFLVSKQKSGRTPVSATGDYHLAFTANRKGCPNAALVSVNFSRFGEEDMPLAAYAERVVKIVPVKGKASVH